MNSYYLLHANGCVALRDISYRSGVISATAHLTAAGMEGLRSDLSAPTIMHVMEITKSAYIRRTHSGFWCARGSVCGSPVRTKRYRTRALAQTAASKRGSYSTAWAVVLASVEFHPEWRDIYTLELRALPEVRLTPLFGDVA